MSSALNRIWKQLPLHRLTQGATLTLRSSIPIAAVTFKPSWRDTGVVHLEHIRPTQRGSSSPFCFTLAVDQTNDTPTSLGRLAPCVNLILSSAKDDAPGKSAEEIICILTEDGRMEETTVAETSKPISKVIYDDGTIENLDETTTIPEGSVRTDYHDGIAHFHNPTSTNGHEDSCFITIETPEALNLICEIESGDINITGKLEGDIKLSTKRGNICVTKLRGHNLNLEIGQKGAIYASNLLEAQEISVTVRNGRIRAKQMHGRSVKIAVTRSDNSTAEDSFQSSSPELFDSPDDEGAMVDISSLFVSSGQNGGATIRSTGSPTLRAVRVKSHHGPLQVDASGRMFPQAINPLTQRSYPVVELGGVNGSCEVSVRGFQVEGDSTHTSYNACDVHIDSLAPETVSLISASLGDIGVTLDRKVEADLRLASLVDADSVDECSSLLADEESENMVTSVLKKLRDGENVPRGENNRDRIDVVTSAFNPHQHGSFTTDYVTYTSGIVVNKSDEPDSRFDKKVRIQASLGKIRIESASEQALDRFKSTANGDEDKTDEAEPARALFAVVCVGKIKVETVSWLGAIARRYGFAENPRELGRTAARTGRSLQNSTENVDGV
jgi:Putative adhesin